MAGTGAGRQRADDIGNPARHALGPPHGAQRSGAGDSDNNVTRALIGSALLNHGAVAMGDTNALILQAPA